MNIARKVAIVLLLASVFVGCGRSSKVPDDAASAAEAVELAGCPNLYKVNSRLYRGAQPTKEGFAQLSELGIKTVIDLRSFHSDRNLLEGTDMDYVHISMEAWDAEYNEIFEFMKVAVDDSKQPVFVHCQHGADRTGTMIAAYRIVVGGWSKEKALTEMRDGPYGFHEVWRGLPKFIENLDARKLLIEVVQAKRTKTPE
jgi:protein-tyrosine phosphatase